ncbi:MAG: amino acid adenylation domain-containing protein [Rhodococcus sp. (in: high G+C Gram-positive bacteria)]
MSDIDLLLAVADAATVRRTATDPQSPSLYQERLWRAHCAAPTTAYSVPCVFDLDGGDSDAVLAAILAVLASHDVFATRIVDAEGSGFALESVGPILPEVSVVDSVDVATEQLLQRGWSSGPLVRVALFREERRADRLAMVFHHAVIDGHSVSLLIADIARELAEPGRSSALRRPRYLDVARVRRSSASWWSDYLSTVPYREVWRPSEPGDSVVSRGDVDAGRRDAASWLTAVAVALARLLGSSVLCLSVPLANRRELEEFDVVGPLVSTVPLVVELGDDDNLGRVQHRVEAVLDSAGLHADVDLSGVVADLRRDDPEFFLPTEIFVNIQTVERSEIALGDAIARPVAVHTGEMKAALTVSVSATGSPEVQIESALPGWSPVTHDGFRDVLAAVLEADPSTSLSRLAIGLVGAPVSRAAIESSILEPLLSPTDTDAVALMAPDRVLTRGELAREIHARTAILIRHGVRPGGAVLLSVERDHTFVTWAAAIMALGAAYVPVDTRHGTARMSSIAAQSNASVAVLADMTDAPVDLDVIDRAAGVSGIAFTSVDLPNLVPDLPAYVIFTSGTTGAPKGVPVTHANLLSLRDATVSILGPNDIVSAVHAFTFDFSVWEIWTALARGAQVVIYDEDVSRDPFELALRLSQDRVSVVSLTNSAFGSLIAARPSVPSLRRVVLGGEQVSSAYVRQWFDAVDHPATDVEVINMLGATETTVHTTVRVVTAADLAASAVQVGEPLEHLDVVVVDAVGRALPRGVEGQITVRGGGLALGYLGRGRLTASRFVPDPFTDALPGSRLYLTGDKGQWLATGELHVDGRIDAQVKVRGHRIETAGVEAVLEQLPGVRRACVVAHENRLLAFVDAEDGCPDLYVGAGAVLAAYEVPDRITRVREFPVTVNGKLDRRVESLAAAALPPESMGEGREPASSREWFERALTDALGIEACDSSRSFLANGGDSILAVRLVGDVRSRGIELSIGDVLGASSIEELAATVAHRGPWIKPEDQRQLPFSMIDAEVRDGLPYDISDAYPLSAAQEGMLFHIRADSEVGVYHNTVSVRIRGGLDPLAFRVALADTVRRHEVLRTSVDEWSAAEPLQLVHRHVSTPLAVVTVSAGSDADAAIDDVVSQERSRPFDLDRAPLFRITLVRIAPGEDQLIISDSHLVLDGWSWTSTLAEVVDRHNALRRRETDYDSNYPSIPVKFVDFVAAERHARTSGSAARAWAEHLRGVRPRRVTDVRTAGERAVERIELDADVLRARAQGAGVSIRHLAMAVHVHALAEVFGDRELVTGVTANGRLEREGGIDARGMFLNMLPLQLRASTDPVATAEECARVEAALMPHRLLPNVDITSAVGKGPLFDFGFNFVRFHRLSEIEKTHTFGSKDSDSHFSQEDTDFALMATFSIHPPEHRLALMLIVDTARVSPPRHRRIIQAYRDALAGAARADGADRGDISS